MLRVRPVAFRWDDDLPDFDNCRSLTFCVCHGLRRPAPAAVKAQPERPEAHVRIVAFGQRQQALDKRLLVLLEGRLEPSGRLVERTLLAAADLLLPFMRWQATSSYFSFVGYPVFHEIYTRYSYSVKILCCHAQKQPHVAESRQAHQKALAGAF